MKVWQNAALQFALIMLQGANVYFDAVPPKYKPLVMLGVAAAQASLGYVAHYYNPDGSKPTDPGAK